MKAAVLAAVAVDAVHDAVLLTRTLVVDDGGLGTPEEALAALAGDDTIVHARRLVPAHLARDDLDLGCGRRGQKPPSVCCVRLHPTCTIPKATIGSLPSYFLNSAYTNLIKTKTDLTSPNLT